MGSLNALEAVRGASFWKHWLGQELASADTVGRVYTPRSKMRGCAEGCSRCMDA